MTGAGSGQLKRSLSTRDLVLLNLVAVTSLRWMATSAATGPGALVLWVLAGVMFFIPLGLAVSALAVRQPSVGGIYTWTQTSFGEGHGFLAGWCYWINNVLYPANLLIATAAMFTYAIGRGGSGLEADWSYVLTATLVMYGIATWLNLVGVRSGKWLQNAGAIATYLPGAFLIALGIVAMATREPANTFSAETMTPDLGNIRGISLWASIAFAFTGLELSATMSEEVKEPRRSLPRAVLISAVLIATVYIAGTTVVLWLIPQQEVNVVSGFLQSISAAVQAVTPTLTWTIPVAALLFCIGNVGGVGAWLSGPARVALAIGIDRYFPPAFGRIHPRWGTPHVAILVQAALSTVFLILSVLGRGTTVETAYLILLDTMLLIYFIPFLYLFLVYLRVVAREPASGLKRAGRHASGISGLAITALAMAIACIPPPGTANILLFEIKVLGGSLLFVGAGLVLYWRARSRR
ncbi:MAG: APC family permease [Gemmatimonadota bacterium]